ncbi:hypothetical protein PV396_17525 [Streptomyces sp. ME02-8801-2C]|uniref:hypothetical protein n=1 Tax=Streptomyces sp. ME02-8801-2C TaxID=3028680 RepID=UPI0029B9A7CC|nr:hypothetical protein [Streptomyces sp. ME02-8801-2C]MDX3453731.1 hypothetical protein [Streptomyces sp. ME02-8801-2C]
MPASVGLEFVNGRIGIKGTTDGNHSEVTSGAKVSLPAPIGIELDTEELKRYVD